MVARTDELPYGNQRATSARARTGPRIRHYTVRQRLAFVGALVVFAIASFYAGLGLLTRAYPALFPGEQAPFSNVLSGLPGPVRVNQPGDDSVFNKRKTFLVIGVDRRSFEPLLSQHRTDVIMIGTIDPVTKIANVLGFPRDLYIEIHGADGSVRQGRINESWGVGVREGGSFQAGADQLARDMEANFGIKVDNWILLDFEGVETLVDAIGGIDVDIPYELSVPDWWYSDESGRIEPHWVNFPAGPQHLDGYNAVAYGRYRNDSDMSRVKRQQLVMQAAAAQMFSRGLLNNPMSLYNAYKDTIQHNVSPGQIPGLANLLSAARGQINTYSIGDPVDGIPTVEGWTTPGGGAVLLWNPDNVAYWLNQAFSKATYSASNVEIQNGYGPGGEEQVGKLGRYLRFAKGFPTVYRGPDAEVVPTSSIIVHRDARIEMAEDIAGWMGIDPATIAIRNTTDTSLPDVVIIIGQDFVVPGG